MSPSPLRLRAGAMAVDLLISLTPFLLSLPLALILPTAGQIDSRFIVQAVFFSSLPAAVFFYYTMRLLFAATNRQTPGQKLLGLENHYPENKTRAVLLRFLAIGLLPLIAIYLTGLWPLLLLPPLLCLLSRDTSYPGDLLAGISVSVKN